jgi:integrase
MRRHKRSGTARVRINGREIQLGLWGSPEANERYLRVIEDFIREQQLRIGGGINPSPDRGQPPDGAPESLDEPAEPAVAEPPARCPDPETPPPDGYTVAMVCAAYLEWADKTYRRPDGSNSSMLGNCLMGIRALKPFFNVPAAKFGPLLLRRLRDDLVGQPGRRKGPDGKPIPKFRKTINRTVRDICRIFKWAVSMELVPADVHQALLTVEPLKKGRTAAPELPRIRAVPDDIVEKTIAHLPPVVADMVRVQRLLGCRPSEVCNLRPCDLDRSQDVWVSEPERHKNAWREDERRISIGPKAQAILRNYLQRPSSRPFFVPAESESQRNSERRSHRKSPMTPSHRARRRNAKRKLDPNKPYTDDTYRRAIERACEKAGVPKWRPNQLRHSAGEEARERFGLDGAQARLGHKHAKVTEVYANQLHQRADEVARVLG